MRYKFYSILYLTVILLYLLRPSLPYIEYAVNRKYIEKNLCVEKENPDNSCHGKCYLHKQLNKQSEPRDIDTKNDKIVRDKKMDDHLQVSSVIPELFEKEITVSDFYVAPGTDSFALNIFVPPEK